MSEIQPQWFVCRPEN